MGSSSQKFFDDLMSIRRKSTSDVAQWWKITEGSNGVRNSSMISSSRGGEVHRMLVNHQTFGNVLMVKKFFNHLLKREKNDIESCWMIKDSRMCSSSEIFSNDLISIETEKSADVGQWPNIGESHLVKRNCSMISSRWRAKGHHMLVNHHTLMNVMMMREIVQWSDLDEEKKDIGCWSIITHWWMWWWWEKLFNDFISMKRKTTSDVGQSSNIGECLHLQRNCSMIWSRWREKGHRMLVNHQTLANMFLLREILQSSQLDYEKRANGSFWIIQN